MDNTGYIATSITPTDWYIGGQGDFFSPVNEKPLIGSHDWSDYLPVVEYQNNGGYDRMACTNYSILNCCEILNIYHTGKEANFSDRYLAKMSGTSRYGNTVSASFDSIRDNGLVGEADWPDVTTSWDDYYKQVPISTIDKGKSFINGYVAYREYVKTYDKDLIFESLNYAPLQVIVRYALGQGLLKPIGEYNHAVTCYGAVYKKYWMIYDHYTQTRKTYDWDYEFGCIVKPTFRPKNMNKILSVKDGIMYMLVEGPTQKLGMGLDGSIVIYQEKIDTLLNASSRLGSFKPATPVTLEQWNSVKKVDGKLNEIK